MTMIRQNSRVQNHRLTTTGATFSVPASEDFTDGSWVETDLAKGEIGINITDDRVYTRTNNGIIELATGRTGNRVQYTASNLAGTASTVWTYTMVPNQTLTVKVYLTGIGDDGSGHGVANISCEAFGGFSCDQYGTASLISPSSYTSKSAGDTYLVKLDIDAGVPSLLVNALTYNHQWIANIEYQTLEL